MGEVPHVWRGIVCSFCGMCAVSAENMPRVEEASGSRSGLDFEVSVADVDVQAFFTPRGEQRICMQVMHSPAFLPTKAGAPYTSQCFLNARVQSLMLVPRLLSSLVVVVVLLLLLR